MYDLTYSDYASSECMLSMELLIIINMIFYLLFYTVSGIPVSGIVAGLGLLIIILIIIYWKKKSGYVPTKEKEVRNYTVSVGKFQPFISVCTCTLQTSIYFTKYFHF